MLKYTRVKLELLTEYDMLLMIEKGIRGGLTQASMRYAKANNERTPDYDPTKSKSWLIYQDCNNLYGWAMSQHMPYGGFKWVEPKLEGLNDLNDTSPIGRIYEVDITYPKELHDKHNDLPFLPQNSIPAGSKVKKLMATLQSKKNYIIHYRNLQQAIANGLIVEKVHRVVQFNQSPWLAPYIVLNTEMRKKAANDFEKDFFKLLNNAVFGKTMESMRKRIKMELVSSDRRLQKLINQSTFKHCTTYNETLNAVALENKIIDFCKPIYIGFAVLEISKYLMYDYHYNVMQKYYDDKIELMYTDTVRGDKGINPLDAACRDHDIAYERSNSIADRNEADHILEQREWERFKSKDSGLKEKAVAWGVTTAMKAKHKVGGGCDCGFKAACVAVVRKTFKSTKTKVPRIVNIPKKGGALPLIPIFAGLSALGALTGGVANVVKVANEFKRNVPSHLGNGYT
ncbi:uncharacterized protein LOC126554820 [Aphis gossypii]|uniref:uncharacterized protein LOC126554820 n=1 Tax=Aphis gossypii TaxID=80765 RepID=UPI0021598625|nr:uncharacterized protein LOC126554820 [Aphis gossypii]